jgi:hypothetical protein
MDLLAITLVVTALCALLSRCLVLFEVVEEGSFFAMVSLGGFLVAGLASALWLRREKPLSLRAVAIVGINGLLGLMVGLVFYFLHWPFARIILLCSYLLFVLAVVIFAALWFSDRK